MSVIVGDDQAGTALPGTLHPVKVVSLNGEDIQVVLFDRQCSRQDDASPTLTYYGWAVPGSLDSDAVWLIMKRAVVGTVTADYFADGNSNYDNIWANRASLVYV